MRKISRGFWFALLLLVIPATLPVAASAQFGIGISVRIGPPAIPVYVQPMCPEAGYIWTPGYWAWSPGGYYWVQGAWVMPPAEGLLWTPGYWGWGGGAYLWHAGYWGPHVGFYGGINYGFGYPGRGYYGGQWRGRHFFYNREVNRINVHIVHNVYSRRVTYVNRSRVSFNGGRGGIRLRANATEMRAARGRRFGATAVQNRRMQTARSNRGGNRPAARNNGGWHSFGAARQGQQTRNRGPQGQRGGQQYAPANRGGQHYQANRGGQPYQANRGQQRPQARSGRNAAPQRQQQNRGRNGRQANNSRQRTGGRSKSNGNRKGNGDGHSHNRGR